MGHSLSIDTLHNALYQGLDPVGAPPVQAPSTSTTAKGKPLATMTTDKPMAQEIADAATGSSYIAASVAVLSGLTINGWGVIIGIILGVATFILSWVYRHKHYQLEKTHIDRRHALIEDEERADKIPRHI